VVPTDEFGKLDASLLHALTPSWRKNLSGDQGLVGERAAWWWTGPQPWSGSAKRAGRAIRSRQLPSLQSVTRAALIDYFDNGWLLTEVLFSALQGEEAFYRPPDHYLRHPLIFYYGHPAAVYVNKLRIAGLLAAPINALFERLFETGVDEMAWDDLSKNQMAWPTVREVTAYRRAVYGSVRTLLSSHVAFAGDGLHMDSPAWALLMGMEHERIHLETSSVLIRELAVRLVQRPTNWPPYAAGPVRSVAAADLQLGVDFPVNDWIRTPAGSVVLGKPNHYPSYGWDNEYGQRHFAVDAFESSRWLISNGEYWAFVTDGGYSNPAYWSETGWAWCSASNAHAPHFWVSDGPVGLHQYQLRVLFDVIDMPWSWPAIVNYFEAKAYGEWLRVREGGTQPYRLLTEVEHHRLIARPDRQVPCAWTQDPALSPDCEVLLGTQTNIDLRFGSESPVDAAGADGALSAHLRGNVWHWCEDHFAALPGFSPSPLYDDFSTPCFDGKHQLILGGSFMSSGAQASLWARFHFRPHFHQHAGFRLVRSAHAVQTSCTDAAPPHVGGRPCCSRELPGSSLYERDDLIAQYLLLHYAAAEQLQPGPWVSAEALHFPARSARVLAAAAARLGLRQARALDIGCAVGGACFELARTFDAVVGVDLSAAFIATAQTLKTVGHLGFAAPGIGEQMERFEVQVAADIDRTRTIFRQADACALPAEMGDFDAVLMANLLCRLASPGALLGRLGGVGGLVRAGGLLLNISPWSWLESYTPRSLWLGRHNAGDGEQTSSEALAEALSQEFVLLEQWEMPLLIREHRRKFQYILSEATLWRRRVP